MKTRLIYTKIWRDDWFTSLEPQERDVYWYLLTNESINSLFIYEAGAKEIAYFTNQKKEDVEAILDGFVALKKIDRYRSYIHLRNAHRYEKYRGWKNCISKLNTLETIPNDVIQHFADPVRVELDEMIDEIEGGDGKVYANVRRELERFKRRFEKILSSDVPQTTEKPARVAKKKPSEVSKAVAVPKKSEWEAKTPAEQMQAFVDNAVCSFRDTKNNTTIDMEVQAMVARWIQSQWRVSEDTAAREVGKFLNHWTEPTKSGKKMLWQTKPTFEIKRRFVTWMGNFEKWGGNNGGGNKYAAGVV